MSSKKFYLFPFVAILTIVSMLLSACGAPKSVQVCGEGNVLSENGSDIRCKTDASSDQQPANADPVAQPTQVTADFPLKGLRFPAYANGSLNSSYDYFVEANGRYWQKWLPACGTRIASSIAFELSEGEYIFNGVAAKLYLDVARNGKGPQNPVTVSNGNDLHFVVELPADADYDTAWALVESDGGCSGGSDIWFQGR
jgi:hypothetical protein